MLSCLVAELTPALSPGVDTSAVGSSSTVPVSGKAPQGRAFRAEGSSSISPPAAISQTILSRI